MSGSLGYRAKMGVIIPSWNTGIEPELADMRPVGVTCCTVRNRKRRASTIFTATP